MKRLLLIIIAMIGIGISSSVAGGLYTDPGRAALIETYSQSAEKALKSQQEVQLLMTTGHVWIESEVSKTTNFQRQFNEYLEDFHDVLWVSAEIYGLYYEISRTAENVNSLGSTLAKSPTNALAVAFSSKRNKIYSNIIANSIDIVIDIKVLCLGDSSNRKMTEEQQRKIIAGIRPKLHKFNKQLRILDATIKYTTFADVWREIVNRAEGYSPRTKEAIAQQCISDWKSNIGMR